MLTPEDNTGLANADSYVDLATFAAFCGARGKSLAGHDDAAQEVALRKAFTYVNAVHAYKSVPVSNDQAGEFPRVDLSDGMGRVFNVVPHRVKEAQMEAAHVALTEDLFQNLDRGGRVVSESVGPISTTYAADAPAEKLFSAVAHLLKPFVRDPSAPRLPLPSFNDYGGSEPQFSVGADDNPGYD